MTASEALTKLLAMPDEPCMHRGYKYTCTRDPKRSTDVIKRDLGTAYVERRRQEYGKDISCVVSVRRRQLEIVRRRA